MKITKSRLKTIILEEMQRMDEKFRLPWQKKPEEKIPDTGTSAIEYPTRTDPSAIILEPYSDSTKELMSREKSGGLRRSYDKNDYGTDVDYSGHPTQAQLDAHDYAARSGGTSRTADEMLASMDLSDLPEAGAEQQQVAAAKGPQTEYMSFKGAGGYNYQQLADGGYYFTDSRGKPGYAKPGSTAALAIGGELTRGLNSGSPDFRFEYGGQQYTAADFGGPSHTQTATMNENRKALRRAIHRELKKTGAI